MNRKERRAAAHKERKLARKAAALAERQQPQTTTTQTSAATLSNLNIPEPGGLFPPLSALTNSAAAASSAPVDKTAPLPTKPISAAQLAANRANAQHSSGPRSESGRAISCQNRTSHGLARHNGVFALLSNEDPAAFENLKNSLAEEHQPTDETESILLTTMAESQWLAQRAKNLQATCFDPETNSVSDPQMFSLYLRYETSHTRAFNQSLQILLKLRKDKRTQENGFEAQQRKEEELRIKTEKHEMKKQRHYWDTLRKNAEACFRLSQNISFNNKSEAENPGFKAELAAELARHGLKENLAPVSVAVAA